ncbi:MAG: hypothetical protein K6A42_02125 [Treponema sp.]|nr:hypothetical protein [Treponema sp.]
MIVARAFIHVKGLLQIVHFFLSRYSYYFSAFFLFAQAFFGQRAAPGWSRAERPEGLTVRERRKAGDGIRPGLMEMRACAAKGFAQNHPETSSG